MTQRSDSARRVARCVAVIGVGLAFAGALSGCGVGSEATETPDSVGAEFAPASGSAQSASSTPAVSQGEAEEAAIAIFLQHMGLPADAGIEEGIVRSSTADRMSITKGRTSQPSVNDQPVWMVVLEDLPIDVPCGPYEPDKCPFGPPKFSVAINADTGDVVSKELTGAGSASDKWGPLMMELAEQANATARSGPTPTPVPVE